MKLKFEELREGTEIPEVIKGPITREMLVDYASASKDYNKLHYDESFAKKAGLEGCIAHGMLVMAFVGSFIKNWAENIVLRDFKIRFMGMTKEGETLIIKGAIVKKYQKNGENLVELDVSSETQKGTLTTQGSAVVVIE